MFKHSIIFGGMVGLAVAVPVVYQSNPEAIAEFFNANRAQPTLSVARVDDELERRGSNLSNTTLIPMDARGHFIGDFKFNGRRVEALIDTGATYVAINESTARRIGMKISRSDYKYEVSTANGKTPAASATISDVSIGRIRVRNVPALVLQDKALKGTLVGMSFLKELDKFAVEDRQLVLRK